jgi:hypothetical protein
MKRHNSYLLFFVVIFVFGLTLAGCSGKSDILKEISGQWQSNQDKATVDINLVGDAKTIKVGDQPYSVSVDKIDMDKYQVNLKVKNGSDQPELWTLREIWNDNGSGLKLAFEHGSEKKILLPKGQS